MLLLLANVVSYVRNTISYTNDVSLRYKYIIFDKFMYSFL